MAGMAPKIPTPKISGRVRRATPGGGSVDTSALRPDNQAPRIAPASTRMYGKIPGPPTPSPFNGGAGFGPMGGVPGG